MTIADRLAEIVKNERRLEILPFLLELSADEKRTLAKHKKDFKVYWEFNTIEKRRNGFSYTESTTPKGTDIQKEILTITSFYCDSQKEFEKEWGMARFVNRELLEELLPLYAPTWFNKYINSTNKDGWLGHFLDYHDLVALESNGYCKLSPELVVRHLPMALHQRTEDLKTYYRPEELEKWPITLDDHVWYFFDYESGVHWTDAYTHIENAPGENSWIRALSEFAEKGRIDRDRLLKESLLASNKNFNKNSSGWFVKLFTSLNPNEIELLNLSQELLSVLTSPHSKVVNTALKYLKLLSTNKAYDHREFIENAPGLLTSETKSVVVSTLMILDKTAKVKSDLKEIVCHMACQTFILQDRDLQIRAAKIINKYGNEFQGSIREELSVYEAELMGETKAILSAFMNSETDVSVVVEVQETSLETLDSLLPMESIKTFEELVFFASKAFDHLEEYHFEMLPEALIHLQEQIGDSNIQKLEPAFQRALRTLMEEWNSGIGYLDSLLATFFLEFGHLIQKNLADPDNSFGPMYKAYKKKDDELARDSDWRGQRLRRLEEWHVSDNLPTCYVFKEKLSFAIRKLVNKDQTPLLSTPTHMPCWIDPKVLVDRLRISQEKMTEINEADLEMAVSRCFRNIDDVSSYVSANLKGEPLALMLFLFSDSLEVKGPFKYSRAWQAAALSKLPALSAADFLKLPFFKNDEKYYSYDYDWYTGTIRSERNIWDVKKGKMVPYSYDQKELILKRKKVSSSKSWKSLSTLLKKPRVSKTLRRPLYGSFRFGAEWFSAEENDIARFLSTVPNNPSPVLISLIERIHRWPTMSAEVEKRTAVKSLQYLSMIWRSYPAAVHDYLGISMLSSEKTARVIAGEIWVIGVYKNQMDNHQIGEAVAKMVKDEFTPLKRFTDVAQTLYGISMAHRIAMFHLVASCIGNMDQKPIRNLKSLLTIFLEIRTSIKQIEMEETVIVKLKRWAENKGLSVLISKVLKAS